VQPVCQPIIRWFQRQAQSSYPWLSIDSVGWKWNLEDLVKRLRAADESVVRISATEAAV
jgi:hypothetical protein